MKKIFTLLAVAAMAITANAQEALFLGYNDGTQETGGPYTDIVSAEPVTVASCDGLAFANGVKMFLVKDGKTYGGGNSCTIGKPTKLSNGAPNLLILPEGFSTNKIEFYGYCNAEDNKCAFQIYAEENGAAVAVYEGSTDVEGQYMTYVSRDDFSPMGLEDMPKVVCELSKAVSGNLWIKNSGKQPAVFINILPAGNESALNTIAADNNAPVEYFNLQGIRVNNPENGLFIRRQGNNVTKVIL